MTQTSLLQSITLPLIGMGCGSCERSVDKAADHAPHDE